MNAPQQWRFGGGSANEAVGQVRAHHLVSQMPVGHSCEVAVMIHGRFVKKRLLLVCTCARVKQHVAQMARSVRMPSPRCPRRGTTAPPLNHMARVRCARLRSSALLAVPARQLGSGHQAPAGLAFGCGGMTECEAFFSSRFSLPGWPYD